MSTLNQFTTKLREPKEEAFLVEGEGSKAIFGNLNLAATAIGAKRQYSTIWRAITASGKCRMGEYEITQMPIHRGERINK